MSFSFGFTKDDFSDDEIDESSLLQPTQLQSEQHLNQPHQNPLDTLIIDPKSAPQLHTLDSILSKLENVRISFDNYTTPIGQSLVYRRELFDVKHQIMTEDDQGQEDGSNREKLNELLIEENNSDLQKNEYEGGFKSWECAYDTVDKLCNLIENEGFLDQVKSVLEFGCGTSLPSCLILMKKLQLKNKNEMNLILSDFNYDVLRLVTLPNILIHWASTLPVEQLHNLTTSEQNPVFHNDEILITPLLIQEFKNSLQLFNINISFVSGSWGRQFNKLIQEANIDFIISSETIYSRETLPIVAESIKEILSNSQANNSRCLLAAKNIYFGVGGSVIEFLNYFNKIKTDKFQVEVEEINDSQLKRSLVNIVYYK
ncbi:uncharacterized protein J8A68_000372 [[Candida] subhashii]|uniref:Histidine protein methyltransferase 1 n=1 Tax=[Candida] subhashii TaxID=561895 RepID=A0A8J5QT75_9ASCO|nr:uncharacterized protein J8A68_000372 [[Candida] subhashii]KAG7666116.1 hypothetical protein J8A68_000372 [[Candida] subhashii]